MTDIQLRLVEKAAAAQQQAYAPYSRFLVGAAVLTPSGNIYTGCNVENAAYPLGNCAEQAAIAAMVMGGEREIAEMVVVGGGDKPCTPCGGCRQRIREFAGPDAVIHASDGKEILLSMTMRDLLPESFGPEFLPE